MTRSFDAGDRGLSMWGVHAARRGSLHLKASTSNSISRMCGRLAYDAKLPLGLLDPTHYLDKAPRLAGRKTHKTGNTHTSSRDHQPPANLCSC